MNNLPTTTRETCISLLTKGANKNWVEAMARESGIDFDEDTKDEFNRDNLE